MQSSLLAAVNAAGAAGKMNNRTLGLEVTGICKSQTREHAQPTTQQLF